MCYSHFLFPKLISEMLNVFCVFFRNDLTSFIIVVFGVVFVFCFVFVWKLFSWNSNFVADNIEVFLKIFKSADVIYKDIPTIISKPMVNSTLTVTSKPFILGDACFDTGMRWETEAIFTVTAPPTE